MNYLYQVRGLTDAAGMEHVDYSFGTLNPLDEAALPLPIGSMGPLNYRVRFFGPPQPNVEKSTDRHCDGTPVNRFNDYNPYGPIGAVRKEGPGVGVPNWWGTFAPGQPFDVNLSGTLEDGVAGTKNFFDSPDWSSLNLQQIGARLNVNALSVNIGPQDLSFLDSGSLDSGSLDSGSLDSGSLDSGSLPSGSLDSGSLDSGSLDSGSLDSGEIDFNIASATLDPTASDQTLAVTTTIDRNTLGWGAPGIGLIRHYKIFRSDPYHPAVEIASLDTIDSVNESVPLPSTLTYADVVNDLTDSNAACGNSVTLSPTSTPGGGFVINTYGIATCYNTTYTYTVVSADAFDNHESGASSPAGGEVTHLFVIAPNQMVVYGAPLTSLTFTVFGDRQGSLSNVSCTPTDPAVRNVGTYPITCSGPATTSATDGVTYNSTYNDGVIHTPGTVSITPRPITVTAAASSKIYDGGTSSTAVPSITLGSLAYLDTVAWTESYDNKNVGTTHGMTPAGTVSDGNSGNNYNVTFVTINTGVITPRTLIVSATGVNKVYDGTTTATVTLSDNRVLGDVFTDSYASASFADKFVGTSKPVTVIGISISGTDAGNYALSNTTANTTADITARH